MAAWNVRTLLDGDGVPERRTAIIARELGRYRIDIAALSETRLHGETQVVEVAAGYTFFCVGSPQGQPAQAGVGFAIRSTLLAQIESSPVGHSTRLMSLLLKLDRSTCATLICAYAPTLAADEGVKNEFDEQLERLIAAAPHKHKLFVLGVFNARVGCDLMSWHGHR